MTFWYLQSPHDMESLWDRVSAYLSGFASPFPHPIQFSIVRLNYMLGIPLSSSSLSSTSAGWCMVNNHPKCYCVNLFTKHSLHYLPIPIPLTLTLWYYSAVNVGLLSTSPKEKLFIWFHLIFFHHLYPLPPSHPTPTITTSLSMSMSSNTGIGFCLGIPNI